MSIRKPKEGQLNDDELERLMYLYRVARADNATPEEIIVLKKLLERYNNLHKRQFELP